MNRIISGAELVIYPNQKNYCGVFNGLPPKKIRLSNLSRTTGKIYDFYTLIRFLCPAEIAKYNRFIVPHK
jgi:hypothetical protein